MDAINKKWVAVIGRLVVNWIGPKFYKLNKDIDDKIKNLGLW